MDGPGLEVASSYPELISEAELDRPHRGLLTLQASGTVKGSSLSVHALKFDRGRFQYRVEPAREAKETAAPVWEEKTGTAPTASEEDRRNAAAKLPQEVGQGLDTRQFPLRFDVGISCRALLPGDLEHSAVAGLRMVRGKVTHPPFFARAAFLQGEDGRTHVKVIGMAGATVQGDGGRFIVGNEVELSEGFVHYAGECGS